MEVACLLYPEAVMRREGEVLLLSIVTGSPRLPRKTQQDVRNNAALCCLNNSSSVLLEDGATVIRVSSNPFHKTLCIPQAASRRDTHARAGAHTHILCPEYISQLFLRLNGNMSCVTAPRSYCLGATESRM